LGRLNITGISYGNSKITECQLVRIFAKFFKLGFEFLGIIYSRVSLK
jgi:hypothetical protein